MVRALRSGTVRNRQLVLGRERARRGVVVRERRAAAPGADVLLLRAGQFARREGRDTDLAAVGDDGPLVYPQVPIRRGLVQRRVGPEGDPVTLGLPRTVDHLDDARGGVQLHLAAVGPHRAAGAVRELPHQHPVVAGSVGQRQNDRSARVHTFVLQVPCEMLDGLLDAPLTSGPVRVAHAYRARQPAGRQHIALLGPRPGGSPERGGVDVASVGVPPLDGDRRTGPLHRPGDRAVQTECPATALDEMIRAVVGEDTQPLQHTGPAQVEDRHLAHGPRPACHPGLAHQRVQRVADPVVHRPVRSQMENPACLLVRAQPLPTEPGLLPFRQFGQRARPREALGPDHRSGVVGTRAAVPGVGLGPDGKVRHGQGSVTRRPILLQGGQLRLQHGEERGLDGRRAPLGERPPAETPQSVAVAGDLDPRGCHAQLPVRPADPRRLPGVVLDLFALIGLEIGGSGPETQGRQVTRQPRGRVGGRRRGGSRRCGGGRGEDRAAGRAHRHHLGSHRDGRGERSIPRRPLSASASGRSVLIVGLGIRLALRVRAGGRVGNGVEDRADFAVPVRHTVRVVSGFRVGPVARVLPFGEVEAGGRARARLLGTCPCRCRGGGTGRALLAGQRRVRRHRVRHGPRGLHRLGRIPRNALGPGVG